MEAREIRPSGATRLSARVQPATVSDLTHKVADRARAAYERERSRYESLVSGKNIRYRAPRVYGGHDPLRLADAPEVEIVKGRASIWVRLATFCLSHRIEPEAYMQAQFDSDEMRLRRSPEPAQLMTEGRLCSYREARARHGAMVAQALHSQLGVVRAEVAFTMEAAMSAEAATLVVLMNDGIELSPLFRYCIARSIGKACQLAAKSYRLEAIMQFNCFPEHYVAHWRRYLPVGFATMAVEAYKDFFNL